MFAERLKNTIIGLSDGKGRTDEAVVMHHVLRAFGEVTLNENEILISQYTTVQNAVDLAMDPDEALLQQIPGLCWAGSAEIYIRRTVSAEHLELISSHLGRIYYNVDAFVDAFMRLKVLANYEAVRCLVLFVIGHERRHEVQPVELYDMTISDEDVKVLMTISSNKDSASVKAIHARYEAQPHESDADMVGASYVLERTGVDILSFPSEEIRHAA